MRAAIYCRVSTEDQEREGTSLDSQFEACFKKADELGYEVPEEFIILETYSGLTLDRPKLPRLRQWVRDKEVDAVIGYTLDRLSRDPVHFIILQEEMEKAGVELILATETIDSSDLGRLITYIKGYAAKLEAEKIRERTMRGARTRADRGKIPIGGTGKLYGYSYIMGKGEHEGVRYINEDQAKWVREMFRWLIDEGLGVNAITYRLRALGVPTPGRSQFWRNSTVHEILTNLAYCGKTYVFTYSYTEAKITQIANPRPKRKRLVRKPVEEWVEIPEATPAIISQETFDLAQAKLEQNRTVPRRSPKRPYLLSGHVFCRRCGRRYRAKSTKPKRGENVNYVPYYECPGGDRMVSLTKCRNRRWNANRLEELVWQQIETLLIQPEMVLAGLKTRMDEANEASYVERELLEIDRRFKSLDKEQQQLLQWALKGFPEETVVAENKRINGQRDLLKQRKSELEARLEQARETEVNMESIERFCEVVRQNLGEFTFEDKRLALEALSIKVWVDGNNLEIEGAIPIAGDDIQSITSKCLE